ncbi:MAG: hypothetical protein GEV05_24630 [Betaproteobacteria bacterium]|nr:hypothetical protein [Betaproteobacteria bacterium]
MNAELAAASLGTEFRGRPRKLTHARALALSGGPFDLPVWPEKNLHTDRDAAREAGLAEIVVSGTQWVGYTVGLLVELCGPAWFAHGEIEHRITRSVPIDETLMPVATLAARESVPSGVRVVFSVRCENGAGEQVLVGKASCLLPVGSER